MLRIKRSVQAIYNTQFNMMAVQYMHAAGKGGEGATPDAMNQLDAKARDVLLVQNRVPTQAVPAGSQIRFVRGETQEAAGEKRKMVNPDEIDIGDSDDDDEDDDDDDDEEAKEGEDGEGKSTQQPENKGGSGSANLMLKKLRIEQKTIPAKVFGGLKPKSTEDDDDDDEE